MNRKKKKKKIRKIFLVNKQNVVDKLFPDPFIKSQD